MKQKARAALMQYWGYQSFRPGQSEVVASSLHDEDVLAVLPTGGGKSICYQVPAVVRGGLTIVISPLIALMQDQVAGLTERGVPATYINSTLSRKEIEQRWTDAEFGRYRLLYLAPERLSSEQFVARTDRLDIRSVAVDEAHCISEWGHHFRPEYRQIAEALERIGRPPVIAVTATATPEVRADIVKQLELRDPKVFVRGFDRPNIVWSVFDTADRRGQIARVLEAVPGTGILYGSTRRGVEQWAAWLNKQNVAAAAYHGGMSPEHRSQVQEAWINDDIRVIAATNAFGMGIDKPDVRFVLHDGIPASVEAYYQEAGRGGRDGKQSFAVLLYQAPDRQVQQRLIDASHPTRETIRTVYETITSMEQIAVGSMSDDPMVVDVGRISEITGLPRSQIESSVQAIERAGLWTPLPTTDHRGYIRFLATPEQTRLLARRSRPALRSFIEGILRAVDAAAFVSWYGLDVRQPAQLLGIKPERVDRGLAFLEKQGYLRWYSPGASLVLQQLEPRPSRIRIDIDALKRSKRHAEFKLSEVVRYAEGRGCRRKHLLDYFGEHAPNSCGKCDICLGRHEVKPVTPDDEGALREIIQSIARGMDPGSLVRSKTFREEEVIQFLDWLERRRFVKEDPAAESGYDVTPEGRAWVDQTS